MLDVRYYRQKAHTRRPDATLLGRKQEAWLWEQLQHDRKYTVIGSGTCIRDGAKRETFKDFKYFFRKFEAELAKQERVLFLSGDIHRNKFRTHGTYFEAISSGVGRIERLGTWPRQRNGEPLNNYGVVEFGSSKVSISLRGRKKSHRIKKQIRSSNWKLL